MDYWFMDDEGTLGGATKSFENFTFLKIFDAGHMVPMDQPKAALNMIEDFMANKTITRHKAPIVLAEEEDFA
jgi:carboxypeptidase C (cathepsin A)